MTKMRVTIWWKDFPLSDTVTGIVEVVYGQTNLLLYTERTLEASREIPREKIECISVILDEEAA